MSRVILANLVKAFAEKDGGGAPAVAGIDLEIRSGELMVLVGPSGCGKTTTLRLIAGLEESTSGTITVGDQIVNDLPPKDRDIAMVFQNYALYPHMSVYENLAFGLRLRHLPRAEIDLRVRDAAEQLGLTELLPRKPKTLSGGQRQRVALGRAIVRQPKVFLFDEPLSNLDAKMRVITRAEIARLHRRLGATMIYVTHDQAEAMTLGERICVMKSGQIQQVAEPMELYNRPANAFVAGFIGSPPMNFLRGTLHARDGRPYFRENNPTGARLEFPLPASAAARATLPLGQPVLLGVRPEHIRLVEPGDHEPTLLTEIVEPLGAETIVHLQTGAHTLLARIAPQRRVTVGMRFRPVFSPEHLHLYDSATEQAL